MANDMAVLGLKYQYARFAGDIKAIQAQNQRIASLVEKLRSRQANNNVQLAALESQLKAIEHAALLAFDINLSATEARQTWPKNHFDGWGAITRSALAQLRAARGVPLTTRDMADVMNQLFGLNLEEPEIFKLREAVRHCMKRLARKGIVLRVSKQAGTERYSTWVIADSAG